VEVQYLGSGMFKVSPWLPWRVGIPLIPIAGKLSFIPKDEQQSVYNRYRQQSQYHTQELPSKEEYQAFLADVEGIEALEPLMKTVSLSTSLMLAMIINRVKTASGIPSTISSTRSRRKILSPFFRTRQYSTQSLEEKFPSNSDESNPKYRAPFSHLIDTMRTLSKVLCQIPEQQEFRLQASYNSRRCRKSTPEFS